MWVGVARALADPSDFGLLGEQSSQKWEIPCLRRRWTTVQNLTWLSLSSAKKSVTLQTNKQTSSDRHIHTLPVGMCGWIRSRRCSESSVRSWRRLSRWWEFRRRHRSWSAADAFQLDRATVRQWPAHRVVSADIRSSGRLSHRRVPHRRAVGAADWPAGQRSQRVQLDDCVARRHVLLPRDRLLRRDVRRSTCSRRPRRRTVAAAVAAGPSKCCCYHWDRR